MKAKACKIATHLLHDIYIHNKLNKYCIVNHINLAR